MNNPCKIFFSWQSDIKESRNLISDCLKQLPTKLKNMAIVEISRDTEGISGAPNIGDTIFKKIENADVFIADISIINGAYEGRKTPNPNVLIELGYAIKALGWERIILLHNLDTGEIEQLPFDINHQRILTFSLQDETKAQARANIIKCVSMTLEILKEKRMLHGGRPDVAQACRELNGIIFEAMKSVQTDYVNRHFKDADNDTHSFVPIPDIYFEKLELAKSRLTEQQYYEISKILYLLQLASVGTQEAYGWEYADQLAGKYFDEVYQEYGEYMEDIPFESVLTAEFVELMNKVAADSTYIFSADRYCDGKLAFSNDGRHQEAYDKEGILLCKGTVENGLFTGFRQTYDFAGQFVNSKKHGEGKEFTNIFGKSRYGCGKYRRIGIWEDDKFVEGKIFSAVLTRQDGNDWICECDAKGEVMTADDFNMDDYLNTLSLKEFERLYFGDMVLKDGDLEVCEESVRAALEYDWVKMMVN